MSKPSKMHLFLLMFVLGCLPLLLSCTDTTQAALARLADSTNQRIDAAYQMPGEIVFAGKVVDEETEEWLNDYLAIAFLNGQEIGRGHSALGKFAQSREGVHDGLFTVRVPNTYELTTGHHFTQRGNHSFTMLAGQGMMGNTAYLYHWFDQLSPGNIVRIQVLDKKIEYALVLLPLPASQLSVDILNGPVTLTADGRILPQKHTLTWSSSLTNFSGTVDDVWRQHIRGRIPNMTKDEFIYTFRIHNPVLEDDDNVLYPSKRYLLPDV